LNIASGGFSYSRKTGCASA